jgi:hypothetical protein
VFCWIVLAMALFFLRPSSATRQGDVKPSDNQVIIAGQNICCILPFNVCLF